MSSGKRHFYVCIALIAAVFAVYGHLWHCDFLQFDDPLHVTENPHVKTGLTWDSFRAAFTHFHAGLWTPGTMISHMVDVTLFGMDPGPHHMVNVALHAVNAVLLLWVLTQLTGSFWPSAAVAALLAMHPLNVESVAWVTERSNLLAMLFWLLAMGAYGRYAARPSIARMALVTLFMAMGLTCKGTLVTLPCALLLIDHWPLNRWSRQSVGRLFLEKAPLFLLAAAGSLLSTRAAASAGAVVPSDVTSLWYRVCNALANYLTHLGKVVWPDPLALMYPIPAEPPVLLAGISISILGAALVAAWYLRIRAPFVTVGILWFLGTLFPMSGIVHVGRNMLADRFMYVPQIGLFIAVVWSAAYWCRNPLVLRAVRPAFATALVLLAGVTVLYTDRWTDTAEIFDHSAHVTRNNFMAHGDAGLAFARRGELERAIPHYEASLRIHPEQAEVRSNLGAALSKSGNTEAAIQQFRRALVTEPEYPAARLNLATHILRAEGEGSEALALLEPLQRSYPDIPRLQYWLGRAHERMGSREDAVRHYEAAIAASPADKEASERLAQLAGPTAALGATQ